MNGRCSLSFNRAKERDLMGSAGARRAFYERYAGAFPDMHPRNPEGWPGFPVAELADPDRLAAYRAIAVDWVKAWRGEAGPA